MTRTECTNKIKDLLKEKFGVLLEDEKHYNTHFAEFPFHFSEINFAQLLFEIEACFKIKISEDGLISEKFTTIANVTALVLSAT